MKVAGGASALSRDDAGARAAFLEAYKVLSHPHGVNWRPAGNAPLQGDYKRCRSSSTTGASPASTESVESL